MTSQMDRVIHPDQRNLKPQEDQRLEPIDPIAASDEMTVSERRSVVIKLHLFPENPRAQQMACAKNGDTRRADEMVCSLSGAGTVNCNTGTSAYSLSGSLSYVIKGEEVTFSSLRIVGERVSGFDAGQMSIECVDKLTGLLNVERRFALTGRTSGNGLYTDRNNAGLQVDIAVAGTMSLDGPKDLRLEANGIGFYFAQYLGDDERLDEEGG